MLYHSVYPHEKGIENTEYCTKYSSHDTQVYCIIQYVIESSLK